MSENNKKKNNDKKNRGDRRGSSRSRLVLKRESRSTATSKSESFVFVFESGQRFRSNQDAAPKGFWSKALSTTVTGILIPVITGILLEIAKMALQG